MSTKGLRDHLTLDCSNPGVHTQTLLEMLNAEQARATALALVVAEMLPYLVRSMDPAITGGVLLTCCVVCWESWPVAGVATHKPDCILSAEPEQRAVTLLSMLDEALTELERLAIHINTGPIGSVSEWRYTGRDAARIALDKVAVWRSTRDGNVVK